MNIKSIPKKHEAEYIRYQGDVKLKRLSMKLMKTYRPEDIVTGGVNPRSEQVKEEISGYMEDEYPNVTRILKEEYALMLSENAAK